MKLAVGIVTHEPDIDALSALFSALRAADVGIFVIDNNSSNAAQLAEAVSGEPAIELRLLETNLGLAAAINILYQQAKIHDADYLMAVDQDSVLQDGHASAMLRKFETLQADVPRLGALGAKIFEVHSNKPLSFRTFRPFAKRAPLQGCYHYADFLISSGTLISMQCLLEVGAMNSWLFIDSVDMDWCFRASSLGWQLLGCDYPIITQTIGREFLQAWPLPIRVIIHDPKRYYWMTRNRRFLYRQAYAPLGWKLRDMARAVLKFVFLMLFSPQRSDIGSAHLKGMRASLVAEQAAEETPV
jgi:rhamnosyltransferase